MNKKVSNLNTGSREPPWCPEAVVVDSPAALLGLGVDGSGSARIRLVVGLVAGGVQSLSLVEAAILANPSMVADAA